MAVLHRVARPGDVGTLIIDAGDNAAIGTDVLDRLQLRASESCSSATVSCTSYPTGATIGTIVAGDDLELGTPAAVSTNTECNDRIVNTGEGITTAYSFHDSAVLGTYKLHFEITTSASRKINFDVWIRVEAC